MQFTVEHEDTSSKVIITIEFECRPRSKYASDGSDSPLVEIYDFNAADWQTSSDANVSGIGRLGSLYYSKAGGSYATEFKRTVVISNSITNYFDGSHVCKLRVTAGDASDAPNHYLKVFFATSENQYTSQHCMPP